MACKICEIVEKKNVSVLYEDAVAMAILLKDEATALGHIQVFPKKHVELLEQLDDEVVVQLFYIASYAATGVFEGLGAQGTNIILNNGKGSNPKHNHVVINVLPRKEEDGLNFQWTPKQLKAEDFEELKKKIKDKTDFIGVKKDDKKAPMDISSPSSETIGGDDKEENYLLKSIYRLP